MIPVFYPRTAAEVLALDVLHRSGWRPVSQDEVTRWFEDRSRHSSGCSCWRCEAAAQVGPDRVWRCLRGWRATAAAPRASKGNSRNVSGDIDPRRPLPEQARLLRDTGLSMAAIAAQLHCAPSTVHKHLHNA
jgi:hypothetical protein